jgi:hypothetical protein
MTLIEFRKLQAEYMATEAVRLLVREGDHERIPTTEERVEHAFECGFLAALQYAKDLIQ